MIITSNAGEGFLPLWYGFGHPAFTHVALPISTQDLKFSFATFSAMFKLKALETRTRVAASRLNTGITLNSKRSTFAA